MLGGRTVPLRSRGGSSLRALIAIATAVTVAVAGLAAGGFLRYPGPGSGTTSNLFNVTFSESGLKYSELGAPSWSVTLAGTTINARHGSITFAEPSGLYNYTVGPVTGYTSTPVAGTIEVTGHARQVAVQFRWTQASVYAVIFSESTLPGGLNWSVTLNQSTIIAPSGGSSSMTFPEPNGTYSFVVGPAVGYSPHPSSGTVTVDGATQWLTVDYSAT